MHGVSKCKQFVIHQLSCKYMGIFTGKECGKYAPIATVIKPHYSFNIIHRTYSTKLEPKPPNTHNNYYKPNFILQRDENYKRHKENDDNHPWIGLLAITVPIGYVLYQSLYSSSGQFKIRNQTFDLIRNDPEIKRIVGNDIFTKKIKSYQTFVDDEGLKRCQLIYKIKGEKRKGIVYVELLRNEMDKQWIMQYCIIKPIYKNKQQYYNCDILEFDFNTKQFRHSDIYVSYKNKDIITYYIGREPHYLNRYNVEKAIKDACNEWSEASESKIKFKSVDKEKDADIVFGWKPFENEEKTSYTHKLGCSGEGFIDFNVDKKWVTGLDEKDDKDINNYLTFSLYSIALHEVGHALGLHHSFNPNEIMAPFHNPELKHLTNGDKRRLQSLWWINPKK